MSEQNPSDKDEKPKDTEVNGDHRGASAAENSGPGTPGNVAGGIDGKGGQVSPAAETKVEEATISGPGK